MPEALRADLAHHRLLTASGAVRLYSRDDVWGALEAQKLIIENVAQGWRPATPQSRGVQTPLAEPLVALPGPPEQWDMQLIPAVQYRTSEAHARVPWVLSVYPDLKTITLDDTTLEPLSASSWAESAPAVHCVDTNLTSDVPRAGTV